jgi:hypothetical protein
MLIVLMVRLKSADKQQITSKQIQIVLLQQAKLNFVSRNQTLPKK